jgi:hypothetical protein
MINQKKLDLHKAFDILLGWKTIDPEKLDNFVGDFYRWRLIRNRKKDSPRREDPIFPNLVSLDNHQELLDTLLNEFGKEGVEEIIIYLLENDHRYENTDTIENYKTYKPYPSYFIQFAYLLIFILPKGFRTRRLFEVFWEHQAKIFPGIEEQSARNFFDPFIQENLTTVEEIRELLVRDWWRWQDSQSKSPYYGASIGLSTWYFRDVENGSGGKINWETMEKRLEQEWREKTGKEPKKWGE